VGLDASKFKAGADSLKGYFSEITSMAGKLVGTLGLSYLGLQGTIEGVKASFGKVMAFEKTQAAIEAVAGGAEKAKALVATLSEITGRNEQQGTALANMARKFINIGMSADEANALVKSFYKAAKAGPDEVTETYAKLENLAIQIEERGVAPIKAWINISKAGIPIFEVMASVLTKNLGRVVTSQEAVKMLEGGAIDAATALQTMAELGGNNSTKLLDNAAKKLKENIVTIGNVNIGQNLDNAAKKLKEDGAIIYEIFQEMGDKGLPVFEVMASVLTKNIGKLISTKEAINMVRSGAVDAATALQTIESMNGSAKTQAAVNAMGYTMAGAMKKAKEEISLYFFEIGKLFNFVTGGTKTYVTLFKAVAATVSWMRNQVATLPEFLMSTTQWIPNFIAGVKFLWASFLEGLKQSAMGWQMIGKSIVETFGMSSTSFGGLGETVQGFGQILKTIFEDFGFDIKKITNLWEFLRETFLLFKEAAQLGFLAIGQIGVKALNSLIGLAEDLVKKFDKITDKIAVAIGKAGVAAGIVDEQTVKFLKEDNARRQAAPKPDFGRFNENNFADARQNMMNEFKTEREKRLEDYKKRAAEREKKQAEEDQKFQRESMAKSMGGQMAAPSLLQRGGADEYKLLVERQQGSLVDLAKQQIDETAKTNQILENVRDGMIDNNQAIRQLQPAAPIIGLIPQG